jgi:hypothetical protein
VDALRDDAFGRLGMSREGLLRRNHLVYDACLRRGRWGRGGADADGRREGTQPQRAHVPLVVTMGGGYSRPPDASVRAHADVFRSAAYRYAV